MPGMQIWGALSFAVEQKQVMYGPADSSDPARYFVQAAT